MNGWLAEYDKKSMVNKNADENNQNISSDDDDQGEASENEYQDLVNVLQNSVTLSFENVEGMSEEKKIMIENIIEIAEYNLGEEQINLRK